jgi:hypothetical protein
MQRDTQLKILFYIIISIVVFMVVKVISLPLLRKQSATAPEHQNPIPLPEDVESVLKGFTYSETSNGLQIEISGKQIIRRGKKILGLRSNLVKTNFIEEIRGTISAPKGLVVFSASDAEWDADAAHPLVLKKNVSVTVNGKTFPGAKNARLYIRQGILEVKTDRIELYNFR